MARKDKPEAKDKGTAVLLMPGIYNETLTLLARAHEYFYHHSPEEQVQLNNRERTLFTSEMSRITIRLSCVMAWLMARKAAFDGKITPEDIAQNYRLECRDICLKQHIEAESILPDAMTDLLEESLNLYERVARLDTH